MNVKQKPVMDSLVRVRSLLDAHPATGPLRCASAREMLDDAVQRLRTYAGAQVSGRELSRAEVQRQADQIAPESDVGRPAALLGASMGTGRSAAKTPLAAWSLCWLGRQSRVAHSRSGRSGGRSGCGGRLNAATISHGVESPAIPGRFRVG